MALNTTEQENLDSLKDWWHQYGKLLLAAMVLLLGGYGGWLLWQHATTTETVRASDLYAEILTLVPEIPEPASGDEHRERIMQLAEQLRTEHGNSIYSKYGALFAAQQAIEHNDLARAESELQWLLDNQQLGLFSKIDQGLVLSTALRLGRIILARGDSQRALGFINQFDPQAFEPGFAELRGDIYLAMGRMVDARDAYVAARQAGSGSNGLYMKLDNLPVPD